MSGDDSFEERARRLADATRDIRAPHGLDARVLRALALRGEQLSRERRWDAAWRSARRGAVMALVAALLSLGLAFWNDHYLASAVATSGEDRFGIGGDP